MLSLNLKSGEYLTIGEDIYIQFSRHSSTAFRASIHAPKDVTILRGEVYERAEAGSEGLHEKPPITPSGRRYDKRHYEEWMKKRALRDAEHQKRAEEKASVRKELSDLAAHMNELIASQGSIAVKEALTRLCARLEALEAAPQNTNGGKAAKPGSEAG